MKHIYIILLLFWTIYFYGQNKKTPVIANEINIIAKYTDGLGMELRWYPNTLALFKMGKKNGYSIQRADFNPATKTYGDFVKIQEVKPYTKEEWQKSIRNNKNKENNLRELAFDLIQDTRSKKPQKLIFNGDTSHLKTLKQKQDNEFAFLTLMTFQDKEVALGIGLGAVDKTAIKGDKYLYRAVVNPDTGINKSNLKDIICRSTAITALQQPSPANSSIGIVEKDHALSILWEETPELVGYYIEKSENGQNYTSLNKTPLVFLKGKRYNDVKAGTFEDENVVNGKKYFYRIYANTLFGDKILVGKAAGTPRDLTPPKTPYLETPKHEKDKVVIKWKFLSAPDADLKGFDIYRSNQHNGEYVKLNQKLLSKNTRLFEDKNYAKKSSNYYKVIAYDKKNNASASMPAYAVIIDDTPPGKPKGIVASVNDAGVVQIVIPKQVDDDIIGYKIFKANQEDHEFSVVEEVFPSNREPLFKKNDKKIFTEKIPLKTLTPHIFYKVKMYDKNFNQSEYSDVIKLVKPDIVPPSPPVIQSLITGITDIKITIIKPSAKDLKAVRLYRKEQEGKWQLVYSSSTEKLKEIYVDKDIKPAAKYQYRVQAVDKNENTSRFSPVSTAVTVNFEKIPSVKKLQVSKQGKYVKINWKYTKKPDLYFVIYRKTNNGVLKQLGHSATNSFTDKRPKKGKNYYACRVMDKNGNSSDIGKIENINF